MLIGDPWAKGASCFITCLINVRMKDEILTLAQLTFLWVFISNKADTINHTPLLLSRAFFLLKNK